MPLAPFPEDWDRALCVAAHPDDLEYGLAAAVARWTDQGKTVTYLLATRGEAGIDRLHPDQAAPLREQEERDGAARVGVGVVEFLGLPDGALEYGLDLRRHLAGEIRRRRPDVVLTLTHRETFAGGGLNQADHRAVGLATLDACADAGNRWLFPESIEQGLPPWPGVGWIGFSGSPQPSHCVDVSDTFERAVASLAAHEEYLAALGPDYPSPRGLLEMILGTADDPDLGTHTVALEAYER